MKSFLKCSMCLILAGVGCIKGVHAQTAAYTGDAHETIDYGELYVSQTEVNLYAGSGLFYYGYGDGMSDFGTPDKVGEMQIGYVQKDGSIVNDGTIEIESSNPLVAVAAPWLFLWEDFFSIFLDWEHYDELLGFIEQKKIEYNSKYIGFREGSSIMKEFLELHNYEIGGYGGAGNGPSAIIPRNAGTAYLTLKSTVTNETKTIKVSVSNLYSDIVNTIPDDLTNQLYTNANKDFNILLSKGDTVKSDVFKAAQVMKKDITFDVVDEEQRTKYAWTFQGARITNPNIDIDLNISIDSDKQSAIEALVNDANPFYLSFLHHGDLPGIAKMRVDVSKKYKDGDLIYLYYYNEEKGSIERTGNKIVVKDGYAEFEISHCSTYFLSSKESKGTNVIVQGDEAIKQTAGEISNGSRNIAISIFVLTGIVILMSKKYKLSK